MDNDLDRSIRLLEDALSTTGRGLLKKSGKKARRNTSNHLADLTVTMGPYEYKQLLMNEGISIYDQTVSRFLQGDITITGNVLQANNLPWKTTLDSLYTEFFEVLQTHSGWYKFLNNVFYLLCLFIAGGHDILDIITDLARCCSDALKVILSLRSKVAVNKIEEEICLEKERNTWRLLFILYQDRLISGNVLEDGKWITVFKLL